MRYKIRFLSVALCTPIALVSLWSTPSFAAGTASLEITQENEAKIIGDWTLIRPGNDKIILKRKSQYTTSTAVLGKYSLLIEPPQGASTKVNVFIDGELVLEKNTPQVAFELKENQKAFVQIVYIFTRIGKISVNTSPPGIEFTLKGPDDMELRDKTPWGNEKMPEGLYSVQFDAIEGCATPKAKSDRLTDGGRIDISTQFSCEGMEQMIDANYEKKLNFVTVRIDGKDVIFQDTAIGQWYAPFIFTAAKLGIVSGYKDANGNLTGKYGPSENVTIAELAKIAHKLAGIDETKIRGRVMNENARKQWFEQYFSSAEQKRWRVFMDGKVNPSKAATRAEVVTTLLQAMNVQRAWPSGAIFTDVPADFQFSSSIETAALDGLIDSGGAFRPNEPINRAEIAKMISKTIEIYNENSPEFQP